MASIASARIGVGSCPSVTSVQNGFGTNGVVSNGVYNLYKIDPQFKWGWSTFASKAGETLNCKSLNLAKTSTGWLLLKTPSLHSLSQHHLNAMQLLVKCIPFHQDSRQFITMHLSPLLYYTLALTWSKQQISSSKSSAPASLHSGRTWLNQLTAGWAIFTIAVC